MNDIFTEGVPQTVQDMAALRERRRHEQQCLFMHAVQNNANTILSENDHAASAINQNTGADGTAPHTLVMFSLVIPGPIKHNHILEVVFDTGCHVFLEKALKTGTGAYTTNNETVRDCAAGIPLRAQQYTKDSAGSTAYWILSAPPFPIKKLCCTIERTHPLGILWDFDVFSSFEQKLSAQECGFTARACLICGKPAKYCARNRTHSVAELQAKISEIVTHFFNRENVKDCNFNEL